MMTTSGDINFQSLADEASDTLRQILEIEGLTFEAAALLPQFERAIRATIAAVEGGAPDDLSPDFALAYLTGRIAKEQVAVIQAARDTVRSATLRAEQHWRNAIEAERRRIAQQAATDPAPQETARVAQSG
jgi:hypothetical protein